MLWGTLSLVLTIISLFDHLSWFQFCIEKIKENWNFKQIVIKQHTVSFGCFGWYADFTARNPSLFDGRPNWFNSPTS